MPEGGIENALPVYGMIILDADDAEFTDIFQFIRGIRVIRA